MLPFQYHLNIDSSIREKPHFPLSQHVVPFHNKQWKQVCSAVPQSRSIVGTCTQAGCILYPFSPLECLGTVFVPIMPDGIGSHRFIAFTNRLRSGTMHDVHVMVLILVVGNKKFHVAFISNF